MKTSFVSFYGLDYATFLVLAIYISNFDSKQITKNRIRVILITATSIAHQHNNEIGRVAASLPSPHLI